MDMGGSGRDIDGDGGYWCICQYLGGYKRIWWMLVDMASSGRIWEDVLDTGGYGQICEDMGGYDRY